MKGYRYIGCSREAHACDFCGATGEFSHTLCYAPLTRLLDEGWLIPFGAKQERVCRTCADQHICKQQKWVPERAELLLVDDRRTWMSIWTLYELVLR